MHLKYTIWLYLFKYNYLAQAKTGGETPIVPVSAIAKIATSHEQKNLPHVFLKAISKNCFAGDLWNTDFVDVTRKIFTFF